MIYRQFSVTIVAAMAFSVLVALTLTPAPCASILKPTHSHHGDTPRGGLLGDADRFFIWFNDAFDRNATRYQGQVGPIAGLDGNQNSGRIFVRLKTWAERPGAEHAADAVARRATRALSNIRDARVFVTMPPAVRGLGSSSGFNFMMKDLNGLGQEALNAAKDRFLDLAQQANRVTLYKVLGGAPSLPGLS